MKIAHIINSNSYSGLENVVCNIIDNFRKEYKDFEMIYVTQDGPIVKILQDKNINYYVIEKMNKKSVRKFIAQWKPDILQAHDYTASVICALTTEKLPIINHLHNNAPWIKKLCPYSISYLYAGRKAKKILTVSNSIQEEYIFSNAIKDKIEVIGNPVSKNKILERVEESDYQKKYDICCVGRLTEAKNPKMFLEVVSKVKKERKDIKAVWVGNGELYKEMISYRDKLELTGNVEFVGFQENPYTYMAKSKMFVLTSKWEGYGLVAFEALSLGLPCIVSKVGGLVNIVDDSCGKLCETEEEFTKQILKVLTDSDEYERLSKNASKKAEQLDNTQEYMKKMYDLYQEIGE